MTTDPIPHRAVLTVTAVSRPDGGHYLNQADFAAHVAQWVKTDLKDHHAIAEVTTSDQTAAPVAVLPTDRAGLRDWIADAVVPLLLDTLPKVIARSRGYEVADAVLSVLPAPVDRAAALTEAERTMLTYALDQAQEKIWSEDGFTDEDQAAVDSLRQLAAGTPQPETQAAPDADQLRITDDGDGVLVHLPEITYLDTQVWAADIGLTTDGLRALRDAATVHLAEEPAVTLPGKEA